MTLERQFHSHQETAPSLCKEPTQHKEKGRAWFSSSPDRLVVRSMPVLSASWFSWYHHWYKCTEKSPTNELCRKGSALWQEQNLPIISRHHLSYQYQVLISGKRITGLTSCPKSLPCDPKALIFCWNFSAASPCRLRSAPGHGKAVSSHHTHPTHPKTEFRSLGAGQESPKAFPMHGQHSLHRGGIGLYLPHKSWELLESRIVSSLGACTWQKWGCTQAEGKGIFGVQLCFKPL